MPELQRQLAFRTTLGATRLPSFHLSPAIARRTGGFTLIEVSIVVVIIGLAAAMIIGTTGGMLDANRRKTVRVQLDTVDTALANFVTVHKRLPCPADGSIPSGSPGAGIEAVSAGPVPAAGTCNPATQQRGVLPWVTLGLSEADATDPWNGRITYRVDPVLASSAGLMNMSNCDPAATGATGAGGICVVPAATCTGSAACTSPANFLLGKGLDVWNGRNGAAGFAQRENNRPLGSGAAYVAISHGPGRTGSYGSNGVLSPGSVPINPDDEQPNVNNQPVVLVASVTNVYRDAPLNANEVVRNNPPTPPLPPQTLTYFDDYLSHPTILAVLNRAHLGPRVH